MMFLAQIDFERIGDGGVAGGIVGAFMLAKWLLHDQKRSKREDESNTEQIALLRGIKESSDTTVTELKMQKAIHELEKQNFLDTSKRDHEDVIKAIGSMCKADCPKKP